MKIQILIFLLTVCSITAYAQEDLLAQINQELDQEVIPVSGTFKGTRLINGHTVETRSKNNLTFIISHRFGNIRGGAYNFFGLDGAQIRLGLDYAVTDKFTLGVGRSSLGKHIDGFVKYRILRQKTGETTIPLSVTYFGSMAYETVRMVNEPTFQQRLASTHQLLLARKITDNLSLQLMPTWIHYNLVASSEKNDAIAVGLGGRYKLGNRFSINAEYFYQVQAMNENNYDAFAIGFDIDTGGHVFQLHLTNANAMIAKGYVGETTSNFFDGDIHFGFNITRNFQLK